MTNLTSVGVTAGIPTSGTGTVSTIDNIPTLLGTVKGASTSPIATDPALVTSLSPNSAGIVVLGQTTKSASVPVTNASDQGPYPGIAVPITASATGTTAATTATLAATAGKTTYISGFTMNAAATAGTSVAATVTGTITGTLNFVQPVGALTADVGVLTMTFNPAIPASAQNTAIACVSGAAGSGGVAAVTAWGYQL